MSYETGPLEQQETGEFRADLPTDGHSDISQGAPGMDTEIRDRESFSERNRRLSQQVCPQTGERVQLMTRKQYLESLKKGLKDF